MRDGGSQREGRATAHLVTLLRPNVEPPLTLSRSPLLPPAQPLPRHLGGVDGFTAVKPSNDHLIRDVGGHRTVPHAARVVGLMRWTLFCIMLS